MKKFYSAIRKNLDRTAIMEEMKTLTSIETGQTFRHYHKAVDHIVDLMKQKGIPNVEKLEYPADGVTAYEDKGMPLAWDASIGKITLCDEEETVVADYGTEPFSLIKGSVSTKKGGEILRIITEDQLLAGEDASESLVLLNTSTAPRPQALCTALDLGARGIIADFVTGRMKDVHAVQWVYACTETASWHIRAEDRDFIGFSINLVMGNLLREKASKGILTARVECDGRRYKGTLPAAAALIPGKRPEEVWLLAHTFEPFMDDDASGIIAGIEIARQITAMAEKPEYSLRLIFAMELYGFAAFHAHFKGKVIGGVNLDTLPGGTHYQFNVIPPIATKPFHGLEFLDEFCSAFNSIIPCKKSTPECFDDMFLSESSTGVPTVWFMAQNRENLTRPEEIRRAGLWHNSIQRESDYLQEEVMADCIAMTGAWVMKTLYHKEEPKALELPPLREITSPMRQYAAEFVFERIHTGLPHDLAYLPPEKRFTLPDGALYGAFTNVLSGMDGKKSVAHLVLEAEADRNITLSDEKIFSYLIALNRLADTSYLKVIRRRAVTPEEIRNALEALSVKEGDLLLVHSALSRIGYIQNGAGLPAFFCGSKRHFAFSGIHPALCPAGGRDQQTLEFPPLRCKGSFPDRYGISAENSSGGKSGFFAQCSYFSFLGRSGGASPGVSGFPRDRGCPLFGKFSVGQGTAPEWEGAFLRLRTGPQYIFTLPGNCGRSSLSGTGGLSGMESGSPGP